MKLPDFEITEYKTLVEYHGEDVPEVTVPDGKKLTFLLFSANTFTPVVQLFQKYLTGELFSIPTAIRISMCVT